MKTPVNITTKTYNCYLFRCWWDGGLCSVSWWTLGTALHSWLTSPSRQGHPHWSTFINYWSKGRGGGAQSGGYCLAPRWNISSRTSIQPYSKFIKKCRYVLVMCWWLVWLENTVYHYLFTFTSTYMIILYLFLRRYDNKMDIDHSS